MMFVYRVQHWKNVCSVTSSIYFMIIIPQPPSYYTKSTGVFVTDKSSVNYLYTSISIDARLLARNQFSVLRIICSLSKIKTPQHPTQHSSCFGHLMSTWSQTGALRYLFAAHGNNKAVWHIGKLKLFVLKPQ